MNLLLNQEQAIPAVHTIARQTLESTHGSGITAKFSLEQTLESFTANGKSP